MSVVACHINSSGYEIAADSITVRGYTQTKGQTTDHSKLVKVNDMIIGSTGLVLETSLFQLFAQTHQIAREDKLAVLDFLSEFFDWIQKRTNGIDLTASYIIGLHRKVFVVDGWLVEEVVNYDAIGAGQDFALAALHLGHPAQEAVETAVELSVFCEGPVQVMRRPYEQISYSA